jgi:hypothetical protein
MSVAMGVLEVVLEGYDANDRVVLRERARVYRTSWKKGGIRVIVRTWARDSEEAQASLTATWPDQKANVWFEDAVYRAG